MDLLSLHEMPPGLSYPAPFLRMIERGLVYFEPWFVLEGERLRVRLAGVRERYKNRTLLPFARREDNDYLACWDAINPEQVVILEDFVAAGWEQRRVLGTFYAWIRLAVEDMITYDAGQ